MGIRIKVARTTEELDCVFKLRHQVYVEEERVLPANSDKRIVDRFDAFPTTVNFIALSPGGIVGNLRLCELIDTVGTPADDFFDFRPYYPKNGGKVLNAGMMCMSRKFRGKMRLSTNLMMMAVYWGSSIGVSHVFTPVNPRAETLFKGVGFEAISSDFSHEKTGLKLLPMMLDLKKLQDRFSDFVKAQGINPYIENFEREFYTKGEKIISSGEEGDRAYFVVAGRAKATIPSSDPNQDRLILNEISEGEVFGELALLTDSIRTADVEAMTDLDLMVLDRKSFQEQVLNHPERSKQFLKLFAERWKRTTSLLS